MEKANTFTIDFLFKKTRDFISYRKKSVFLLTPVLKRERERWRYTITLCCIKHLSSKFICLFCRILWRNYLEEESAQPFICDFLVLQWLKYSNLHSDVQICCMQSTCNFLNFFHLSEIRVGFGKKRIKAKLMQLGWKGGYLEEESVQPFICDFLVLRWLKYSACSKFAFRRVNLLHAEYVQLS